MAFNTLEYLEQGKVEFLYRQTPYDREQLIHEVRKATNKNDIIKGFLPKVMDSDPSFCFAIIYDNDSFAEQTKELLAKGHTLTDKMLINLLKNTSWGKDYFYTHIEEFESTIKEKTYPEIFAIILASYKECERFIEHYKSQPNTHIRFLFMKYLLKNHEELFGVIYPNVMLYLTSVTYRQNEQLTFLPDYMDNEDICDLALLIFKSRYRYRYFGPLKEFILKYYPENDLAKVLIRPLLTEGPGTAYHFEKNVEGIDEFSKDANTLFLTSATEKFNIIQNYPNLISKEILEHYLAYYKRFRTDEDHVLSLVNVHRLGEVLLQFIDKYLALSKNPTWRYLESGSTGTVYQMGDYVLKLFRTKWSYEDVICPDLYLIIKNLEEIYIRNPNGVVECGIEVQPYLAKGAEWVTKRTLANFEAELARLGYRSTDAFVNGPCGDNCRILDSYQDANCKDPESLPNWFKKTPLVLVDRDRIYPKDQRFIRQLSGGY